MLSNKGEGEIKNIAVDWIAKNLYYSDNYDKTLNMVSIRNMTNKKVLLDNKNINSLVVHPDKG